MTACPASVFSTTERTSFPMPHSTLARRASGASVVELRRPAPIDWDACAPRGVYARFGRPCLDLALIASTFVPVVALGALVGAANLVAFRDPRKAFYVQPRVGHRGRTFHIVVLHHARAAARCARVVVERRGRGARHAARPLPAQHAPRRTPAVRQHPARRDELHRAAPRDGRGRGSGRAQRIPGFSRRLASVRASRATRRSRRATPAAASARTRRSSRSTTSTSAALPHDRPRDPRAHGRLDGALGRGWGAGASRARAPRADERRGPAGAVRSAPRSASARVRVESGTGFGVCARRGGRTPIVFSSACAAGTARSARDEPFAGRPPGARGRTPGARRDVVPGTARPSQSLNRTDRPAPTPHGAKRVFSARAPGLEPGCTRPTRRSPPHHGLPARFPRRPSERSRRASSRRAWTADCGTQSHPLHVGPCSADARALRTRAFAFWTAPLGRSRGPSTT